MREWQARPIVACFRTTADNAMNSFSVVPKVNVKSCCIEPAFLARWISAHPKSLHCYPPRAHFMHVRQTKIEMQEQQIRQLEHHAAQLKESLRAGGLISKSINSGDGVAAEGAGGEAEQAQNRGADGDLP